MSNRKRAAASRLVAALLIGGGLLQPRDALATPTAQLINCEAVNDYSWAPLSNSIADCQNLLNYMTRCVNYGGACNTYYYTGQYYTDSQVWYTDFWDADRTISGGTGSDSVYWDHFTSSGNHNGIGVFSGHGDCGGVRGDQTCISSSACTSPPSSTSPYKAVFDDAALPGVCERDHASYGHCAYKSGRDMISGNEPGVGWFNVNYSAGYVALGEGSYSGTFGAAGINGGVNFAMWDNSCGIRAGLFSQDVAQVFAGVRNVALVMPHGFTDIVDANGIRQSSDTADTAQRGYQFGYLYQTNPNQSIAHAWANTLGGVTDGSNLCPLGGSAHGINGCGANVAVTYDSTCDNAIWNRDSDTYLTARDDAYDSKGTGCTTYVYYCNYDCFTYSWTM